MSDPVELAEKKSGKSKGSINSKKSKKSNATPQQASEKGEIRSHNSQTSQNKINNVEESNVQETTKEETQDILNELNSDNISRFIEVIISSKSVVSNDFCCSNKKRKVYKSNYFCYKNEDQIRATIRFKSDKISPIIDNNNFSSQNCLTFLIIYFSYTFISFLTSSIPNLK